jgi:hypothetical protein
MSTDKVITPPPPRPISPVKPFNSFNELHGFLVGNY